MFFFYFSYYGLQGGFLELLTSEAYAEGDQKGDSSILCVIEDVLMGTIFGIGLMAGSFGIGLGCWVMVRVSSRVRVG